MPKPYPKVGPYNIIADTNALRAQDSRKLVSAGFEAALAELRKITTVHLHIPDVVIGELAYQKFEMAAAAIETVNSKLNLIVELTGGNKPTVTPLEKAKKNIQKRYHDWCKASNAHKFMVKITQADWNKIVDDAVWRALPFEPPKDERVEKGLRDRVVLEAVKQLCSTSAHETVLLTGDGLLSQAAIGCSAKNLTVVPRLEDFTSRVRMLKEQRTKEWAEALFAEATRAFYATDKPDCLYWKEKIPDRICARVEDLKPGTSDPLSAIHEPNKWDRQTDERITLGTTQFLKTENVKFQWKTDVHIAAAFSGNDIFGAVNENLRISSFAVLWSSRANGDGEIMEQKVERLDFIGRQMVPDTADARAKWNVPPKPPVFSTLPPVSPFANLTLKTTPGK